MKNPIKKLTESQILLQQAEDLYKIQVLNGRSIPNESDVQRLNHKLSVHQIELEIQNIELLKAKEDLEVAVEKYTDLYDFAPTGYITLSKEGQIVGLNLCASKMLGKERSRLMKNMFGAFVMDDTKQNFYRFLREIFNNQIEQSCEVTLITRDVLPRYIYIIGHLSKNASQCDISMIDISGRKEEELKMKDVLNRLSISNKELALQNENRVKRAAELIIINKELENLNHLNADKNLFISVLAHDMRSPFSVILGYSELLIENIRQYDIDQIEKFAKEIYQSGQKGFSQLDDLLKWARMQSGKITFEPQNLIFSAIINSVVSTLKPLADTKNITLSYLSSDHINVFADSEMLKSVLRNLVSNAIKFTNKKGKINISAVENSENVTISVSDNGIGIPPDSLDKTV